MGNGCSSASAVNPTVPPFAYFIDNGEDSTLLDAIPAAYAIISNSKKATRDSYTSKGRVFGWTSGGASTVDWSDVASLFSTTTPAPPMDPAERTALAKSIHDKTPMLSDPNFPIATEGSPNAKGGYTVWTQDFEGTAHQSLPENAAAIIATLWAGRVLLGPSFKAITVPASRVMKRTPADWDLNQALTLVSRLGLLETLSPSDQTAVKANEVDLFSFLRLASVDGSPLVDGVLAQQYSYHKQTFKNGQPPIWEVNPDFPPGSLGAYPPFYDKNLPYAVCSSANSSDGSPHGQIFIQGTTAFPRPWTSHWSGNMPFKAGLYFGDLNPKTTVPNVSDYLVPE